MSLWSWFFHPLCLCGWRNLLIFFSFWLAEWKKKLTVYAKLNTHIQTNWKQEAFRYAFWKQMIALMSKDAKIEMQFRSLSKKCKIWPTLVLSLLFINILEKKKTKKSKPTQKCYCFWRVEISLWFPLYTCNAFLIRLCNGHAMFPYLFTVKTMMPLSIHIVSSQLPHFYHFSVNCHFYAYPSFNLRFWNKS